MIVVINHETLVADFSENASNLFIYSRAGRTFRVETMARENFSKTLRGAKKLLLTFRGEYFNQI